MHNLFCTDIWLSFLVLTLLEITLSGDNIIFLVTASSKLPKHQQKSARKAGLILAMISRIAFLSLLFSATQLFLPLFDLFGHGVSLRNLIFFFGGAFLVINPCLEIHEIRKASEEKKRVKRSKYWLVLLQIMIVDIIFSIDSVVTAIGVSQHLGVMVTAILVATLFMLLASNWLAALVQTYPMFKILGLCFLILIGIILLLRGLGLEVSSTYIYVPFVFVIFTQIMLAYTKVHNVKS